MRKKVRVTPAKRLKASATVVHLFEILFQIQAHEIRLFLLLFLYAFLVGLARHYIAIPGEAIFLQYYNASKLSYAFIMTAPATVLVSMVYLRLGKNLSLFWMVGINLSFILGITLLLYLCLSWSGSNWPAMALVVWVQVAFILTPLALWNVAAELLDMRQGKRLFPLLYVGDVFACALVGFSMGPLVRLSWFATSDLLLCACCGCALSLWLLSYLSRKYPSAKQVPSNQHATPKQPRQRTKKHRITISRYILLIIGFLTITNLVYYFLLNGFTDALQKQFPDSDELTGFLGLFSAAAALGGFCFNFFAARINNRWGLIVGLMCLPVLTLGGFLMVMVGGYLLGSASMVFWAVTCTRLADKSLRRSQNSALISLYQPLRDSTAVQTKMNGIVQPVAGGLAGILLWSIHAISVAGALELAIYAAILCIIWIAVILRLRGEYIDVLMKALKNRNLFAANLPLLDAENLSRVKKELASSHAENVIYALDVLEDLDNDSNEGSMDTFLTELLEHEDERVREDVLVRLERLDLKEAVPSVSKVIARDPVSRVRGAALRAFIAIGGPEKVPRLLPYTKAMDRHLQKGAYVGLLRSGGIHGVVMAGADILQKSVSENREDREFAAIILGEVGIRDFFHPLMDLLRDNDSRVRREALISAGKLGKATLWPMVIENLERSDTYSLAVTVLIQGGDSVLPFLDAAFYDRNTSLVIKYRIIQVYKQFEDSAAVPYLIEKMDLADKQLSYHILLGLRLHHYIAEQEDRSTLKDRIKNETSDLVRVLETWRALEAISSSKLLISALHEEFQFIRKRIFLLLSFLQDPDTIQNAFTMLDHPEKKKRAYAVELLDNVMDKTLKPYIMPMIEDLSPQQRVAQMPSHLSQSRMSAARHIGILVEYAVKSGNPWLIACALYTAGTLRINDLMETVREALSHESHIVSETALWSLRALDKPTYQLYADKLINHASSNQDLIDFIHSIDNADAETPVVPAIEKVNLLKQTLLFSETPEMVLLRIIPHLEEITVGPGKILIRQGDSSNSMYLIIAGHVLMYDTELRFSVLEPPEVFGRLDLVDASQDRISVVAERGARLLKFDLDALYGLLIEQPEVAISILKMLSLQIKRKTATQDAEKIRMSAKHRELLLDLEAPNVDEADPLPEVLLPIEKILLLKRFDFFEMIPDRILEIIVAAMQARTFEKDEWIIQQGDIARYLDIIVSGTICIHRSERTIRDIHTPILTGKLAVLGRQPHDISVIAEEEVFVLRLDWIIFKELITTHFELSRRVIHHLGELNRGLLRNTLD